MHTCASIGVLQAGRFVGLCVPADFSSVAPLLTTVAQTQYTLGRRAMDMTLNGQGETDDVVLTPHLVERVYVPLLPQTCRRVEMDTANVDKEVMTRDG